MSSYPATGYKGHGPTIVIVNSILAVLAILVVSGRIYLRAAVQRNADISDWLMLAGLAFTITYMILVAYACQVKGLDWHVQYLTLPQIVTVLKYTFAVTNLALWATYSIKMSILLFYRRIARHHLNRAFITILHVVGVVLTLQFIASLISLFLTCRPVNAFWMAADPEWDMTHEFTCINRSAYIIAFGAINVAADVILTILPTAMIHKIQLPRIQKIALWILFSVGILSSIAAIMRMYYSYVDFVTPKGVADPTYWGFGIYLWTSIEFPIAMICASGPTLKTLFLHMLGKRSESRTSYRPGNVPTIGKKSNGGSRGKKASGWSIGTLSRNQASGIDHDNELGDEHLEHEIKMLQLRSKGWGPYATTFEIDDGATASGRTTAVGDDKINYVTTMTSTEMGKAYTTVTTTESRDNVVSRNVPEYALPMPSSMSVPPTSPRLGVPVNNSWEFQLAALDVGNALGGIPEGRNHHLSLPTPVDTTQYHANHNSIVVDPAEWKTSNSPTACEKLRLGSRQQQQRASDSDTEGQGWPDDEGLLGSPAAPGKRGKARDEDEENVFGDHMRVDR